MNNEKAFNLEFFDENINNGRDFNFFYKKAYEREKHIVNEECVLNYLLDNNNSKVFNPKMYMIDSIDDPNLKKFNINNYQAKIKTILNKDKTIPLSTENSIIQRVLGILKAKDERKNKRYIKLRFNNIKIEDNKENKSGYINTEGNKEAKKSFYEKYLLPKINNKNSKNNEDKNSFESSNDIFKNTSIINNINENTNNKLAEKKLFNPINCYSPCLKRNIFPYFRNVSQRHSISVKKGKIINDNLHKIHDIKSDINNYNNKKNIKSNDIIIKNVKINDRKYHLINLFKDLGKVKSKNEIEKTLFEKDDKSFKILKLMKSKRNNNE